MWKVLPVNQKPDQCLGEWIDREALAEAMIPLIGQLYRNNNVVSTLPLTIAWLIPSNTKLVCKNRLFPATIIWKA
jgi:hypothetical protein